MVEIFYNKHASNCKQASLNYNNSTSHVLSPSPFCELNPEYFLFMFNFDFYLIKYYRCITNYDVYKFKEEIIENVCKHSKTHDYYDIIRSRFDYSDFEDKNKRISTLNRYFAQVNYIYGDNFGKRYAITTNCKFIDVIFNNELLEENYKKADEYLKENNHEYLRIKLLELYKINKIHIKDEHIVSSIDEITQFINKFNYHEDNKKR